MIVSKITPLVSSAAEITQMSPEIVSDVVKHLFTFTKNYLQKPDKAGLRITYLGVIRPQKKPLNFYLKKLIAEMRLEPDNEELKENFRIFWNLRRLSQKDAERRDFKKRYGT